MTRTRKVETIIDLRRKSAALRAVATIWEWQKPRKVPPEPFRAHCNRRPAQIDDRVHRFVAAVLYFR